MDGKEVNCTCKFIYAKVLMIAGIIVGALLAVLGIVCITADTNTLFASPIVRWYKTDYRKVSFTDAKGFSSHEFWARPHEFIEFIWTTQNPVFVMECDAKFWPLKSGWKTKKTTNGDEIIPLDNMTIDTHYYCRSHYDGIHCEGSSSYQGKYHMYTSNDFRTNGILGNQDYRFTIFIFAAICIAFGVVMILGELHVPLVVTKFTFFYYSFVKGLIYIAWGFPVMGLCNLLGLFTGVALWIIGILNCIYGWRSLTSFQWNKIGQRGTTSVVTRREYI